MPRRPRLHLPGFPLHITQRGVNRCAIFVDDADRRHLYQLLLDAVVDRGIAIHAYAFMGNHIHLLLTASDRDALSGAMHRVGMCYVQAFNLRHGRSGPLWQGRFKSCLVDSDRYLLAVYRYIELNPVRAMLVERPERHPWSSARANLGLIDDPLVRPHPAFLALGADPATRTAVYGQLLDTAIGASELGRIHVHLQQERALGDPAFQAMVERTVGRPVAAKARGRPRQRAAAFAKP